MIPALEWASFAAQNGTANDLLVQACGMVLLAGGGLLFFRAFREKYLLAWAMGWAAYVVFRLAEAEAQMPGSLWAQISPPWPRTSSRVMNRPSPSPRRVRCTDPGT